MSNFFEALKNRTPIEVVTHEFRLYYNKDNGSPLFYSMEDAEGDYIIVDKETYVESSLSVRVIDGKLKKWVFKDISKLVVGTEGTTCHPSDITVVANEGTVWEYKQYVD